MSDVLSLEKRDETGTLRIRRLRQTGMTPAVLYGHGEDTIHISIPTKQVDVAMRAGNQIVEISGVATGSALIKDVQWDAFGTTVLHMDLSRVDATESVDVTLSIELKGTAPGTKMGGTVKQLLSEIDVKCPANKVPDKLEVSINELEMDQTITVAQLELPAGATMEVPGDTVIVQCAEEVAKEEEETEGDAAAEPEVIGRKAEDEESGDS